MKICGEAFFWTQNGNETNPKIKKTTHQDTTDSGAIAVICFIKSASILFECFCRNGGRLYYFRMKSRKTSEKKEGDRGVIGANVWNKSCRRLL